MKKIYTLLFGLLLLSSLAASQISVVGEVFTEAW